MKNKKKKYQQKIQNFGIFGDDFLRYRLFLILKKKNLGDISIFIKIGSNKEKNRKNGRIWMNFRLNYLFRVYEACLFSLDCKF